MSTDKTRVIAELIAEAADSKMGEDVVVLDMSELVSYTDFLIICSARNERQASAIMDEVRLRLKHDLGILPGGVEGKSGEAGWAVLDYLDCIVHVFTPEARALYNLEDLWRDAPRLEIEPAEASSTAASAG